MAERPNYTLLPRKPCVNCGKLYVEHIDEKCPFEASEFKHHPREILYVSAGTASTTISVEAEYKDK
jgi:hypothetical protein